MKKKMIVFNHPSVDEKRVKKVLDDYQKEYGKQFSIERGSILWDYFPDKFPNIFIEDVEKIRGQHVVFIANFGKPGIIFEQMGVINALPRYGAQTLKVLFSDYPDNYYVHNEKNYSMNCTITALSILLNNIPFCISGKPTGIESKDKGYCISTKLNQYKSKENVCINFSLNRGLLNRYFYSKRIYNHLICYPQETKNLAERVANQNSIESMLCHYDLVAGWAVPNFDYKKVQGRDIIFFADMHNPEVLFNQMVYIYNLAEAGINSLSVILPFFPTGTMERVDKEGVIATAMTLARMLNAIPMVNNKPTKIDIWDMHALSERFFFTDTVLPDFHTAIPLLLKRIEKLYPLEIEAPEDIAIVFPDEGARKRYEKYFKNTGFKIVECTKVREGDKRIVQIKEGKEHLDCRYCIIVDDMIQKGGTAIECAKQIKEVGEACTISIFVIHGVFAEESHNRFVNNPKVHFDKVWITDSCAQTVAKVRNMKPFEVLSLAGEVSSATF